MKKYKTYSTNPELCVVGAKCHVCLPSLWIGAYEAAKHGENEVWLPAKVTKVEWGKDNVFKEKYGIPSVTVNVRASKKYGTGNVVNLWHSPTQVESCIRFR